MIKVKIIESLLIILTSIVLTCAFYGHVYDQFVFTITFGEAT